MARLLSYKRKDVNRYRTFCNVSFGASTDTLMFKTMPKAKTSANISPSVHKASQKGSQNRIIKPQKHREWITCCWHYKLVRKFFCCCMSCKDVKKQNLDNDDDIDRAVEDFKKQQGISVCDESQKSILKSKEESQGYWRWDESWKSNSDKFLESLELDCVGSDKSLKRAADKLRVKNSKIRKTAFNNSNGGG